MKRFVFLIFSFWGILLSAENFELTSNIFIAPASEKQKNVSDILKDQKTQKLFTARILSFTGTTSSCSLVNHFELQKTGLTFKATPEIAKKEKRTSRINVEIDWLLLDQGPFNASEKESFFEGTIVSCTRNLRPGIFSPLGINVSKDAKVVYIPALQFIKQPKAPVSVFYRNSRWEITVKVTEDGKAPKIIRTVPSYHRGRLPATNSAGIKCRMYNYQGITVMNMYYSHQRGIRKNGKPVMEELALNLCFAAPRKGTEILLADLTSFCFAENAAFTKLPADGGKQIRYQVFLTVK